MGGVQPQSGKVLLYTTTNQWSAMGNQKSEKTAHCKVTIASVTMVINGECPVIGANVDIGVGTKIIGSVHIADGCKIGTGAVVVTDFPESDSVIGGVPARKLK